MTLENPDPTRWAGRTVVVAAPGPSLTEDVAEACRGFPAIVVNNAWQRLPWADILFACDAKWWHFHHGVPAFQGEKWSSHGYGNDKHDCRQQYGLKLIAGKQGSTFSVEPGVICYGRNSGFQAVNLAIQFGASRIVLVGFNMQIVGGLSHFHGDHPPGLRNADPIRFAASFRTAAQKMPAGVTIINATPDSALDCFPKMDLQEALSGAPVAAQHEQAGRDEAHNAGRVRGSAIPGGAGAIRRPPEGAGRSQISGGGHVQRRDVPSRLVVLASGRVRRCRGPAAPEMG